MTSFRQAIVDALLRHPASVHTNTPVDVLAAHMINSLNLFEASLLERSRHPFYDPGKTDAQSSPSVGCDPVGDLGPDVGGLYRDRPLACEACED